MDTLDVCMLCSLCGCRLVSNYVIGSVGNQRPLLVYVSLLIYIEHIYSIECVTFIGICYFYFMKPKVLTARDVIHA